MSGPESRISTEFSPTKSVVDALRGIISVPTVTISHKPGKEEGQIVEVHLAMEGPGMFGLTDWQDNKNWSGIFNHSVLSARYSLYFAEELAKKGSKVNPQRVLDGMIVSHSGRRQWDEAGWYPEKASRAKSKRKISNERLGLRLIKGKVPNDVFELVAALGHEIDETEFPIGPKIYESLDYRVTEYVDHRTAQKYEPLHTRMGDFLLGNFFKREDITPELKERIYIFTRDIIERQKESFGKEDQPVDLKEADQAAAILGASPDSQRLKRKELLRLILQDADIEALLESKGISTDLSDELVPMPKWEKDLRRSYVLSARESIKKAIISRVIEKDFDKDNWWEKFAINVSSDDSIA